jgi:hypothetical protein
MNPFITAPTAWVEAVGQLCLPPAADQHMQRLMDRNTDGHLSQAEAAELAALVELSENLSLVRAEALQLLGRKPQ